MVDSVVEELARKRLGRTIKGKWRLDRLIGVGGMAAVYAATHRNGARVAIKMLHPTISASTQIRARFIREGYLANKVDHPGVVRVLDDDVDDSDQSAFLVMDLVIGTTLAERAMERLLDAGEVLDVADQVLQVLASAHEKGIVHRDLKPDNLLVDRLGKIHVLDFGIARLLDDGGFSTATKTGTAFGTPGFMAPEQAMGRTSQISARTDIYALGATLFALVCGDFVHAAENPQELLVLVATQPARSLRELAPHMAKEVVDLIDKSTQNLPSERWQSADQMLTAVREARRKLGVEGVRVLPLSASGNLTPEPPSIGTPPGASQPSPLGAESPRPSTSGAVVAPPSGPQYALGGPRPTNPEPVTLNHPSRPEPSGNGAASVPLVVASPYPDDAVPRRRPKIIPVAIVGGTAALIGVIAIVAATTGRSGANKPASATTPATETAPAPKPLAIDPATVTTAASVEQPAPSVSTTATGEPKDAEPKSKLAPPTKGSGKGFPNVLVPTSTASATAKPAGSGKKIDLGY